MRYDDAMFRRKSGIWNGMNRQGSHDNCARGLCVEVARYMPSFRHSLCTPSAPWIKSLSQGFLWFRPSSVTRAVVRSGLGGRIVANSR